MKKFNPKIYQNKARIYPPVPGAPNIRKIFVWDTEKKEYRPPSRGKIYVARRYEVDDRGKKTRKSEYFENLEAARNWQSFINRSQDSQVIPPPVRPDSGPTFQQILVEWQERKFPSLRRASKIQYRRVSRIHFEMLLQYPINLITSKVIDNWLVDRKANLGTYPQDKKRLSFDRELMVLGFILGYYGEYYEEDTSFRNPIKKRHWKDSKLNIIRVPKKKDVKEEEFHRFRPEIEKLEHGKIMKHLATTQYYQALRISEAAALKWKHIIFNWDNPKGSLIQIDQHIVYSVEKGELPSDDPGFKNSDSFGGMKEMPMFPKTFETLSELYGDGVGKNQDDYVFPDENGNFFKYHIVKNRYDRAFKNAGLVYTATHVLRHGWTEEVFNATGGDYGIAGQLLGDKSDRSIRTYAKRRTSALADLAHGMWEEPRKT